MLWWPRKVDENSPICGRSVVLFRRDVQRLQTPGSFRYEDAVYKHDETEPNPNVADITTQKIVSEIK